MSIRSFDSLDDLFGALRADHDFANQHRHLVQSTITFGSRVVSVADRGVLIFGHVYTEQEFISAEEGAGATADEAHTGWDTVVSSEADGMVFGNWFSTVEPTGELGSQNKINLWPILPVTFTAARWRHWDPDQFPNWLTREVSAAVSNAIEHRQQVYLAERGD